MTMIASLAANARNSGAATPPVVDRGAWRGAIGLTILSLAGFGFLYSLAGVGLGQALFPRTANGSVIEQGGKVIGSELMSQPFASNGYFQPRPSAAGYNPMALAGSNQARTNPDLRKRLEEARAAVAQREGVDPSAVPGDLFTQSGGGIDPHVSPAGAAIQIARVARARGLGREVVEKLVAEHTEGRQLGAFGEPRVNVLVLNLALDALAASPAPSIATVSATGR
ncbi:potassium-transporting ATPase subunit KdpC [Acidovorax sp. MR-S7]|uniref:potassium-transporting ATPase subunit KdpC n=1 Tax=Acidovorax sp. MR-S7 TaxID=1268622 RepID=UPI00035CDB75|nr:potassium-transporting ATPase subunit KdpC [Acidovorax sp. MR-S7]GAD22082.1 K+-transporting ATPase, c chain [Acidovorax sp. MR-S7]